MGDIGTLAGAGAAIFVAASAGIFKFLQSINNKFADVSEKIDQQTRDIRDLIVERHTENVQRLTRLETLVNGYKPRRKNG